MTTTMGPDTPFMASLLEDPRFCDVAEQLGGDVFGVISDVNQRVGDTLCHPDQAGLNEFSVKFVWYRESVGTDSGALRGNCSVSVS